MQSGVPVELVSERMGHASTAFTTDVYAQVTQTMQAEAANGAGRLLQGGQ
jgi:hypothetical protein